MPSSRKAVAARLVALREGLGVTQAELCRLTGFSTARWAQYETGKRDLTLAAALILNEKFKVTLDFLFLGDRSGLPLRLAAAIDVAHAAGAEVEVAAKKIPQPKH